MIITILILTSIIILSFIVFALIKHSGTEEEFCPKCRIKMMIKNTHFLGEGELEITYKCEKCGIERKEIIKTK